MGVTMKEFTLTKKQAKELFDGFVDGLKEKDIVYISKVLSGSVTASKDGKKYMKISHGVHPQLFKDKGESVRGLLNSQIFLVVVPNKDVINPEILEK